MNDTSRDTRTVLTLDAGGTNFVFSAVRGNEEATEPIRLPSNGDNLELCLRTIEIGFTETISKMEDQPSAISFAFPGPADYPAGIIGDLANLPSFRGGVPLGPILEDKFGLPVYINNDGDLFAYGEAIAGLLPDINNKLMEAGSPKRFNNLFGVTLGTGFGGGLVINGELFLGDNSAGAEVWCMRSKLHPSSFVEEDISIRAIKREYERICELSSKDLTPKDIYDIAKGTRNGNQTAAIESFRLLGEAIGDALANICTILDCMVVIGGGLSASSDLFLPALINEMNSNMEKLSTGTIQRMESRAFNLENKEELAGFIKGEAKNITVPGREETISYDTMKRVGIGLSRLGTSKAISIGAYSFALNELNKR
jgi:glucokinase